MSSDKVHPSRLVGTLALPPYLHPVDSSSCIQALDQVLQEVQRHERHRPCSHMIRSHAREERARYKTEYILIPKRAKTPPKPSSVTVPLEADHSQVLESFSATSSAVQ